MLHAAVALSDDEAEEPDLVLADHGPAPARVGTGLDARAYHLEAATAAVSQFTAVDRPLPTVLERDTPHGQLRGRTPLPEPADDGARGAAHPAVAARRGVFHIHHRSRSMPPGAPRRLEGDGTNDT
jgi:hypothetical protein